MARPAKKEEKKQEPTAEERLALFNLLYGSSLFSAHPVIVTNVQTGVAELLTLLGRPDLADLWADPEKVSQLP